MKLETKGNIITIDLEEKNREIIIKNIRTGTKFRLIFDDHGRLNIYNFFTKKIQRIE